MTYLYYQIDKLGMTRSRIDPWVLIKRNGEKLSVLVLLQVEDSFGFGDREFLDQEEAQSVKFRSKPRKVLDETLTAPPMRH